MHEGLTVDPRTGFDEGPRLSRWLPSMKVITTAFLGLWLFLTFGPFEVVPWVVPLCIVVLCGAATLVLGLEARALSRCPGADTSASRQLRWERSIIFGAAGLAGTVGVGALAFGLMDEGLMEGVAESLAVRIVLGTADLLSLAALLTGLALTWRHRPDRIGPPPTPGAP